VGKAAWKNHRRGGGNARSRKPERRKKLRTHELRKTTPPLGRKEGHMNSLIVDFKGRGEGA